MSQSCRAVRHGGFGNERHAGQFFVADAKNRFADSFAFGDWQLQFVEGDLHLRRLGFHRGTNVMGRLTAAMVIVLPSTTEVSTVSPR